MKDLVTKKCSSSCWKVFSQINQAPILPYATNPIDQVGKKLRKKTKPKRKF